jgi:hypothetical protein
MIIWRKEFVERSSFLCVPGKTAARNEARLAELGSDDTPHEIVDERIRRGLGGPLSKRIMNHEEFHHAGPSACSDASFLT